DLVGQRETEVIRRFVSGQVLEGKHRDGRLTDAARSRSAAPVRRPPDQAGGREDENAGRGDRTADAPGARWRRDRRSLAAVGRNGIALEALQVGPELRGALIAEVAVLLEGGVDDPLQLGGQLGVEL